MVVILMKNDFFSYIDKYFNVHLVNEIKASNKTIDNYKYSFKLLFNYIEDKCFYKIQDFTLDRFTKDFILNFLSWTETDRNNSISTRNLRLAFIKSFTSFIFQYEIDNSELIRIMKIPRKKDIKKKPDVVTEEEIKILLSQPNTKIKKGRRQLAILSLMYDAGLRIDELLSLKVKNINDQYFNTINVLHGKGNKQREVPISDDVSNILRIYINDYNLKEDDYLFSNSKKEKLCSNAIRKIINKNIKIAKKQNPNFPDKINPHKFRHSKATHLINKGVSVVEVKEFLGHADLSSTQIYITTDLVKKREALKTIEWKLNNSNIKTNNVGSNEWIDNIIH